MVDSAQAVPAAEHDQKPSAINCEQHLFVQKYVKTFMKFLFTDGVTASYNLRQVIYTIEQGVYSSELIKADNKNTRQSGHILLKKMSYKAQFRRPGM